MKKIIKENIPLERFELPAEEAARLMEGQPYKEELIAEHAGKGENISFYKQGDFTDLCAAPPDDHRLREGCKAHAITGAYCGATPKTRCSPGCTACPSPSSLCWTSTCRCWRRQEAGPPELARSWACSCCGTRPRLPFFLPKGMVLKNLLIDYWREVHKKYGYVEVSTPIILSRKLWERSGHWDHYKDNMYTTVIDEEDYAIKPMNCPAA